MSFLAMRFSLIRKGFSALAVLALLVGIFPQAVFASSLGAPTDVEVEDGTYTNDTTPTFTWDAPSGATWYEVAIDSGSLVNLGNVLTYTSSTLSAGWHTFYVIAHDNSGHTSSTASVTFEIDTAGPTVPEVSPSYAYEDESTTFSVSPYGDAAPTSCVLYVDGSSVGDMTKNGSTFTKSYTFSWDGTYTVYARCTDADGNTTNGTSRNVTVYDTNTDDNDEDSFVVPEVSPSYAYEDESTTFSVEPYGDLDAETCYLYVDSSYVGTMTEYSGGEFKHSYTFSNDGSYTVYAYCEDENSDWTRGDSRTVTVYDTDDHDNDDEYPEVQEVSPSTATEDEEVTITVEPEEDAHGEEVRWCDLYVDGDNVGDMDEDGGEFSIDYTFTHDGYFTVYATCTDEDYDTTVGDSRSIHVYEQDEDEDGDFTVPAVSPSSADEDEETEFTVEPYGDLDAEACKLYVDGENVGSMSEDDGEFSRDYTFSTDGEYTVYAYCEDENGDWHKGTSRTVDVDDDRDTDTDELEVPEVTPSSADEDEETEFTVRPTSDYNVTSCWLYVDGDREEFMDEESSNKFVAEYTFTQEGSYSVYAVCKDSSGDEVTGDKRTVTVGSDDNYYDDDAEEGSLIKISCGSSSSVSDPCRAVYYYGEDGKRHAFPNEGTFYSWYNDFDDVIEVSSDFMSSISLGENVTYRPGSVLLKFESSNAVYAIEEPRTLRHYETWSLLEGDYGDDAADYIVVLPDSLYASYEKGSDIDSSSDYNRTDAYYSVDGIEDIF
jgi:hypothetical protein